MNKKVKVILFYLIFGFIAIRIPAEIFRDAWFEYISTYLLAATVIAMIIHFGKTIQNLRARRKYYIYISLIIGQGLIFQIMLRFFGFDTLVHPWLAPVFFIVSCLLMVIMLFDIAKTMDSTNVKLSLSLRVIAILCLIVLIPLSFITFATTGRTSGVISVLVDNESVPIGRVNVEFSFTTYNGTEGRQVSMSGKSQNGRFSFNRSEYALYFIRFSLKLNTLSDIDEEVHIEIQYFNTNQRANINFDIQINIMSEHNMIEVSASDGRADISSGVLNICPSKSTITLRIPSP